MKKFLISLAAAVVCLPAFAEAWKAVTSVSEIKAGNEYLIVCPSKSKVMGEQNGSYRDALSVTFVNGELASVPENASVVTLEPNGTDWNLKVSDGYLSYSGSSNAVYTDGTPCAFTISVSANATTIVPANVTSRKLQYNANAPRFACYSSNQTAIQLYKSTTSNLRNPGIDFTESVYYANLYGSNTFPSLLNPENLYVTYSSSIEDVATIDAEGNITLLSEGETTIYAKFEGNDEFDACEVSYTLFVSDYRENAGISFAVENFSANLYRSNAFPKLNNPYNLNIIYASSNEAVAIIDTDGNISLLSEGETTISAKFEGNGEYYAGETSYILTVTDPREQAGISFDEEKFSANLYGTTIFPKLTNPHNLAVTYASSNEPVATIDANGKVTLLAEGETTIFAKFKGNNEYHAGNAAYILTVNDPRVYAGISFPEEEFTVRLDKVFDSPILLNPNNVTVTYKSRNENVATVDAEGKVTLVGEGATSIIATSADTHSFKSTTAEYSLNVINPTITLDDSSLYTITEDGYAELKDSAMYKTDVINVIIPDNVTIDGTTYKVGSVGHRAFNSCELLESVKLPVNLQKIGAYAFTNCKSLQCIDIPESVTIIYEAAFMNCYSLTCIKFPDSLNEFRRRYNSTTEQVSPIQDCTGLTEVILPDSKSPDGAWSSSWHSHTSSFLKGCTSIKEIVFPDNVNGVSGDFFAGNNSIEKITIGKSMSNFPSSITTLSSLKELEVSDENPYLIKDGYNFYTKVELETTSYYMLAYMFKEPEDGVLRLMDNTETIQSNILRGKNLKEVVFPSNTAYIIGSNLLSNCKVGKLVIPENINFIAIQAFRGSDIDTLIIAAADTPLVMDLYDSTRMTDAVFLGSKIRNLIINRDIDNINNYGWPKSYTRAFYHCTIDNLEINVSLGEKACGMFTDASISNIRIGENVKSLYALGCYEGQYNMEIYTLGELTAPFHINNGPLNRVPITHSFIVGLWPRKTYVYPSEIDRYKQLLKTTEVYPLPGCVSILFDEFSKTVRPEDEFTVGCKTYPDNFEIKWTSSNPAVATVSDNGEVTALSNGVARITATGAQAGYTDASTSMLVYVSEDAPIEPSEAYLTMKGLSNHAIRHTYKAGTNAEINILPEDDWYVHSVTLNGEDISDSLEDNKITTPKLFGENEMNVVLLKNETTYVNEELKADNIKIRCSGNNVTVLGAENSDEVRIFNTNGECVYHGIDKTIALSAGTVYILKVKSSVFKFML